MVVVIDNNVSNEVLERVIALLEAAIVIAQQNRACRIARIEHKELTRISETFRWRFKADGCKWDESGIVGLPLRCIEAGFDLRQQVANIP